MKTLKDIQSLTKDMEKRDQALYKMWAWMDRAFRCDFDLPKPLDQYEHIRKIVSTDPYVALRAGTWVLAANDPVYKVNPCLWSRMPSRGPTLPSRLFGGNSIKPLAAVRLRSGQTLCLRLLLMMRLT
jgi:hypothetical protein